MYWPLENKEYRNKWELQGILTKFGFLVMQVQELDLYLAQRTLIFLLCTNLSLNSTLVPSFTSITLRVHLLYIL